jgi:hypothetical protein
MVQGAIVMILCGYDTDTYFYSLPTPHLPPPLSPDYYHYYLMW